MHNIKKDAASWYTEKLIKSDNATKEDLFQFDLNKQNIYGTIAEKDDFLFWTSIGLKTLNVLT